MDATFVDPACLLYDQTSRFPSNYRSTFTEIDQSFCDMLAIEVKPKICLMKSQGAQTRTTYSVTIT